MSLPAEKSSSYDYIINNDYSGSLDNSESYSPEEVDRVLNLLKKGQLTYIMAQVSAGDINYLTFQKAFNKYQHKKKLIDLIELFAK